MPYIVCYHKNCTDGMMSAWVIRKYLNENFPEQPATFIPITPRGTPDIDPTGTDIIMADVTLSREVLIDWKNRAKSLIVLDHHISSQRDLEGLDFCKFDQTHSGAGLCWEHFFPCKEVPWQVAYTEDRDLWAWKLPNSKEVSTFLVNLDFTFEAYDSIPSLDEATAIGSAIYKADQTQIKRAVKHAGKVRFGKRVWYAPWRKGIEVPVVNSSNYQSEIGNELAKEAPFGVVWYLLYDNDKPYAQLSLRSCDRVDVSEVARQFGGGGHANAAGCRISFSEWTKMLRGGGK